MSGGCAAFIPALGDTCGQLWPGEETITVARRCACGHEAALEACELHVGDSQNGGCLTCKEVEGHDCPIAVTPLGLFRP